MRKSLILSFLLAVSLALVSCGGGASGPVKTSGIPYRAFVSNSVTASTAAGIFIVNAETDVHPGGIAPISAGTAPGMMLVTPNRAETLVFSPGSEPLFPENQLTIVSNATEAGVAHATLPGYTESFVVSPDSSTGYVAVPNAPVVGQPQGAIKLVVLAGSTAGFFAGEIDIPGVHYLAIDNGGDRILAFSDNSDSIAVVTPSNLGTSNQVVTYVGGFDRPVQAFFSSDDTTAYVVNCGAECGGTQASVQQFDMTTNTLIGAAVSVCGPPPSPNAPPPCAASEALVNGSTMYLAGTPYTSGPNGVPSQPCSGEQTAATSCGLLSLIDLSSMTVTGNAIITDGYHNRMAMGANGQLFLGARTCTEINSSSTGEVRGCLSIYNTLTTAEGSVPAGGVVIPPANGDVTGIQPIGTRSVVYVVQGYPTPGGSLYIYDATTDALQIAPANEPTYAPLMLGSFYDVKTVDF